jgi:hypothetical protein
MQHTDVSLDQRLHKLILPNSDLAKEMEKLFHRESTELIHQLHF